MTGIGMWVVEIDKRRIRNTGTQRHVRAPGIVMVDPRFHDAPQMRFRQRNQPIQALATDCADNAFANRIGHRTAWWRFQYRDSELSYRFVEVFGKDAVAIVKEVLIPL